MNSLSGDWKCSGLVLATCTWCRVWAIRETQRWNTGSAYGRKPVCSAVATDDKHWEGEGEEMVTNRGYTILYRTLEINYSVSLRKIDDISK